MSIPIEQKEVLNAQQMEVAVHGPDGATHLILCTGIVELIQAPMEPVPFSSARSFRAASL